MAGAVLELLGGADNIVDVTNCVTRLRVNVKDETLVADDRDFKSIGTSGIAKNGKGMQVIIGLKVPKVRERFEAPSLADGAARRRSAPHTSAPPSSSDPAPPLVLPGAAYGRGGAST